MGYPHLRSVVVSGLALLGAVALAVPAPAPAAPTPSSGNANLKLRIKVKRGGWENGRALKAFAYGGAKQVRVNKATRTIFPVTNIDFSGPEPVVFLEGSVALRIPNTKGKRVRITGLEMIVQPSSTIIAGTFPGGALIPVLQSGKAAAVDPVAGSVRLGGSGLKLTEQGRHVLHKRFGVHIEHGAAGTGGLGGQAKPMMAPAVPLAGGHVDWGISNDWRQFILGGQGGGASGEALAGPGVLKSNDFLPAGFYEFPFASGTFEDGLYGDADRYSLQTAGTMTFGKEGKGWTFANPSIRFQGPTGELFVDIGTATAVPFATLGIGSVASTLSADGRTISWQGVPATLTAAGAAAWGRYKAGEALDPVSFSATFG
ncbi:MAG: HtaA domain-containing protein [Actinobacteria bacterium]|nr:HtaA domain-containing protein [Actinomycetota bacterium]